MRRFELKDATSSKFWEVDVEGKDLTVRFGKIGTNGQTQTKSFPTAEKATSERDKLIKEKTGKGYAELLVAEGEKPASLEKAEPKEPAAPKAKAKGKEATIDEPGWIDAGDGYRLALREGKLACRGPKGQLLASVPKDVKASPVAMDLIEVRDWLDTHARECVTQVESWMLRSLPTPREVLASVWPDHAWRTALENAVVVPADDPTRAGFFRGVDDKRGIGVVNLDGETVWIDAATVTLPHPILLAELDDFRALAAELKLSQGIAQLFRETFAKPKELSPTETAIKDYRNGKFAALQHALGVARKHGFRVSGGNALARVWQEGRVYEARYWIGSEDPASETWTDELVWVDDRERVMPLGDVHPVAFSEGMRMAGTIYAARVIEKEQGT
jgi:predicted DNA-binding WGR domain protein